MSWTISDPASGQPLIFEPGNDAVCRSRFGDRWRDGVLDLVAPLADQRTSAHYAVQWGSEISFQSFARDNPAAMQSTPSRQLGWGNLFDRIRTRATKAPLRVLDAACGFGGIMDELFRDPVPPGLRYIGADIHGSLHTLKRPEGAGPEQVTIMRWDISNPLPVAEKFDAVICRASIHHTPQPEKTFQSLCSVRAGGGVIAISAYALKGQLRETVDEALRDKISAMSNDEAYSVSRELTQLARAIQDVPGDVVIESELSWLGIPPGKYGVHELLYDYMMKFWFNKSFGERYSDVVNFDWYHPPYAYRYRLGELLQWFEMRGLHVQATTSTKAQHYLEGGDGDGQKWQ